MTPDVERKVLLNCMTASANAATMTVTRRRTRSSNIFKMTLVIALIILSLFLVKKEGYEEYGVAGLLIGGIFLKFFLIYYIFKYLI